MMMWLTLLRLPCRSLVPAGPALPAGQRTFIKPNNAKHEKSARIAFLAMTIPRSANAENRLNFDGTERAAGSYVLSSLAESHSPKYATVQIHFEPKVSEKPWHAPKGV